jgi:hypothetical protein
MLRGKKITKNTHAGRGPETKWEIPDHIVEKLKTNSFQFNVVLFLVASVQGTAAGSLFAGCFPLRRLFHVETSRCRNIETVELTRLNHFEL